MIVAGSFQWYALYFDVSVTSKKKKKKSIPFTSSNSFSDVQQTITQCISFAGGSEKNLILDSRLRIAQSSFKKRKTEQSGKFWNLPQTNKFPTQKGLYIK
jgi:hypothetical protein